MLETFSTVLWTVLILNTRPINRLSKAGAALVNTISSIWNIDFYYNLHRDLHVNSRHKNTQNSSREEKILGTSLRAW